MSLLIDSAIRAQLKQDIKAAWPTVGDRIYSSRLQVKPEAVPFAICRLDEVPMAGDSGGASMTDVEQTYVWQISYQDVFPQNGDIEDLKSDIANLLISQLMSSANYAGVTYLPRISNVRFAESDDPQKPVFEVMIEFECKSAVSRLVSM